MTAPDHSRHTTDVTYGEERSSAGRSRCACATVSHPNQAASFERSSSSRQRHASTSPARAYGSTSTQDVSPTAFSTRRRHR